jgi:hypothetical protein
MSKDAKPSTANCLQSQDFTLATIQKSVTLRSSNGEGVSMFEDSLRENIKNISVGLGLSAVVIGAALALAFW